MQVQSITPLDEQAAVEAAEALLADIPLRGRLRPATQVRAMLAYARTSKSIQTSIPAQHDQIAKMARQYAIPITRCRQDKGKSGWRSDRAEYRAVLEDLASGEYSHLGLYKADRLARDSELLIGTVHACWRLGITVLDTTVGEITPLNLHMLAMFGEMELRQLSQRTTDGLEEKAKDRKLGRAPLGYKHGDGKGVWLPDEDGLAPIIRELGQRFAAGESIMSLVHWLNGLRGAHHDASHVRRILHNEFYAGWVVNRKQRKSILEGKAHARPKEQWSKPFRHPYPLWDEETWQKIQARLILSRNVGQHRDAPCHYALQGIIWCAQCDRRMHGNNRHGDGRYYICPFCHFQRGLRKVEAAVRQALENIVLDSQEVARVQDQMTSQRSELECKLAALGPCRRELHDKRKRVYDRLDASIIDEQQYKDQVAEIDTALAKLATRENDLKRQINELPVKTKLVAEIATHRAEWLYWPDKIPAMPIERQQQVYRECCARVLLNRSDNSVTVEYTSHLAPLARRARSSVHL